MSWCQHHYSCLCYFLTHIREKRYIITYCTPKGVTPAQRRRNNRDKISSMSRVLNTKLVFKVDTFLFVRFDGVGKMITFSFSTGGMLKMVPPVLSPESGSTQPDSTFDAMPFKKSGSILAYVATWSSQELTEQHALVQAEKLLPEVPEVLYLGVPWAMWFERFSSKALSSESFQEVIDAVKFLLNEQKFVVTVCQHVDLLKYQDIFCDIGITHVFWTFAVRGQLCFPVNENIKDIPFSVLPRSRLLPNLRSRIQAENSSTHLSNPNQSIGGQVHPLRLFLPV